MTEQTKQEAREANRYEQRPNGRNAELYQNALVIAQAKKKRQPVAFLGHVTAQLVDKGKRTVYEPMIHVLPLGTMHGSSNDVERYLKRGFVLLDWWFPKPEQVPQGQMRSGVRVEHGWALEWKSAEGQQRRGELIAMLQRAKGDADAYSAIIKDKDAAISERDALKAQVEEMKAKLNSAAQKEIKPRG